MEGWISTGTAAKILGVSPTRVRQLIAAGRLLPFRTPLGALVDARAVERLKRERRGAAEPAEVAGVQQ